MKFSAEAANDRSSADFVIVCDFNIFIVIFSNNFFWFFSFCRLVMMDIERNLKGKNSSDALLKQLF